MDIALLVDEDSSSDDESMPSLVDRHSDFDFDSDDSNDETKEFNVRDNKHSNVNRADRFYDKHNFLIP